MTFSSPKKNKTRGQMPECFAIILTVIITYTAQQKECLMTAKFTIVK